MFTEAFKKQANKTTTENGMPALVSTKSAVVDFFYKAGGMRGQDGIEGVFLDAYQEDPAAALVLAFWLRDVRGGAGERQLFRQLLAHLAETSPNVLTARFLSLVPEYGRWDDLLILHKYIEVWDRVIYIIGNALLGKKDALCAKWMPRKGDLAVKLRKDLGFTPKQYRKVLVELTKVVETQMCAKNWNKIKFEQVPSLAHSRYTNAFNRNSSAYQAYKAKLQKGETEIKAGAVYPYDIVKSVLRSNDRTIANKQWEALSNYIGDASILPMVDVSGSMGCSVGGTLTAMDVAISLGIYCAEKNEGKFKGICLTFSEIPTFVHLKSKDLLNNVNKMRSANWGMNTDFIKALDSVLDMAVRNKVKQKHMPKTLLVLSDMQFDEAQDYSGWYNAGHVDKLDKTAMKEIKSRYKAAGYKAPNVVFWNLRDAGNVPAKKNDAGVALVSGFSPAIMKHVLADTLENLTPTAIVAEVINSDRYASVRDAIAA